MPNIKNVEAVTIGFKTDKAEKITIKRRKEEIRRSNGSSTDLTTIFDFSIIAAIISLLLLERCIAYFW